MKPALSRQVSDDRVGSGSALQVAKKLEEESIDSLKLPTLFHNRLHQLGIDTIGKLLRLSVQDLKKRRRGIGKTGIAAMQAGLKTYREDLYIGMLIP
ncbi:MAG: DNA-directed RNA polymerase subunit alpha C-terminal domain-containing protein [Patescibacteria group bacterium]